MRMMAMAPVPGTVAGAQMVSSMFNIVPVNYIAGHFEATTVAKIISLRQIRHPKASFRGNQNNLPRIRRPKASLRGNLGNQGNRGNQGKISLRGNRGDLQIYQHSPTYSRIRVANLYSLNILPLIPIFLFKFAVQTNFQMLGVISIPLSGSASKDAQRGCSFDYSDFHRPFHHCLRWSFFLPDRERGERGCTRKTGGTGTANAGKLSRSRLERWNQMEAKSLSLL